MEIEKKRAVIKKWSEIAEKNPELTPEESKEIYTKGLKYCKNCKQWVTPTKGPGGVVTALIVIGFVFIFFGIFFGLAFVLGILMIIVGMIYGIIKVGSGDRCPICNSQNWGKPSKEGRE